MNSNNTDLKIVSGIVLAELLQDSEVLCRLGLMEDVYREADTAPEWTEFKSKVVEAYRKVGVICISGFAKRNKYFFRGVEVTRLDAQKIAEKIVMNGNSMDIVEA